MNKDCALLYDIFMDDELSGDAKIIATLLGYRYKAGITFISEKSLDYMLEDKIESDSESKKVKRQYKRRISAGLRELIEKNYVSVIDEVGKDVLYCDLSALNTAKKKFVLFEYEAVKTIFLLDKRESVNLFKFYGHVSYSRYMKNSPKFNGIVGIKPMTLVSYETGFTYYAINKYKRRCSELKLLYFAEGKPRKQDKDQYHCKATTVYSFWRDRKYCIEYLKPLPSSQELENVQTIPSTHALAKKYYYLSVKGKEYSEDEMEAIYRYVRNRNKKIFAYMFWETENKDDYYKDKKPWSEEYFKDYPFYEKDEEIDFLFGEPGRDSTNSVNPYENLEGSYIYGKDDIPVTNTDYLN